MEPEWLSLMLFRPKLLRLNTSFASSSYSRCTLRLLLSVLSVCCPVLPHLHDSLSLVPKITPASITNHSRTFRTSSHPHLQNAPTPSTLPHPKKAPKVPVPPYLASRAARRARRAPQFAARAGISGHRIGRSMEALFAGREIRRIVLLRDKLELQISFYNWQMMDNLAKGLGTYRFALHQRAFPRDFIGHFLLSRWLEIPWRALLAMKDANKHDMLNRNLAGFWFVGGHADCDRLIATLGRDLGIPPVAPRRNSSAELQGRTGWRLLTTDDLPAAARRAFRAHNRLDQGCGRIGAAPASRQQRCGGGRLGRVGAAAFSAMSSPAPGASSAALPGRMGLVAAAGAWPGRLSADRARDLGQWEIAARHYRQALQAMPEASAIWVRYGHALRGVR